jgi:GDPmannose 4,6-dehydratase
MWLILQQRVPRDYVIATGHTCALRDFVTQTFQQLGLDWLEHVEHNPELMRPSEIRRGHANPRLAAELLGWKAKTQLAQLIANMIQAEREPAQVSSALT